MAQNDKKKKARDLYMTDQYTQKEIAEMVGTTPKSVSTWATEDNWDTLRQSLITSKEEELRRLYRILGWITKNVERQIEDDMMPNTKDADAVVKYSAAIKSLENETSIAEAVEVMMGLCNFISKENPEMAKSVSVYGDKYIQSLLR